MRDPTVLRAILPALVVTLVVAVPILAPPSTVRAVAAPGCGTVPVPAPTVGSPTVPVDGTPWPQLRYEPQRLAGIADGGGVVVAVLDSGVDAGAARLTGRVLPGTDELDGGDGHLDCVGHGTAVASIIGAAPGTGTDVAFAGLAPGALILPVRVTEREDVGDGATGRAGTLPQLAMAIRWAVGHGAKVLNLSLVVYQDVPVLREAIADAVRHDVVVVAAVGNGHRSEPDATAGGSAVASPGAPGGGDTPDATPYPAGYPGVIGVGAIGADGQRSVTSPVGPFVDIVAPGSAVPALARGGQLAAFDGSSFAAPFVSATAALIRQEQPDLHADQVMARIFGTADPSPDGPDSPGYGVGILDPYRAATEDWPLNAVAASPAPLQVGSRPDVDADDAGVRAVGLAAAGAGMTLLFLIGTVVLPRGVRRRWRPGRG
jgi:type VII secretion-associated serine protease mycosin